MDTKACRTGTVLLLLACVVPQPGAREADAPTATMGGNVYTAGNSVRPQAPVEGDFVAFGGRVIVDQPVQGDALLAGGAVDVRAPVGDDVRAAGGDVSIESTVGGQLMAAGGNVALARSARIARDAALAGRTVTIAGTVSGDLEIRAQRVAITGEVGGDARVVAQRIELGPDSRIGGALRHASGEIDKAEGAVVAGGIANDAGLAGNGDREWGRELTEPLPRAGPPWLGMALGYLGLLAAGAVFLLLFPRFAVEAPDMIRRSPGLSLAVGLGTVAGVPVLAVLLFVTLLGIPLGIAALALYPLLLLVGYLAGAIHLAQRARSALGRQDPPTARKLLGPLALALLALVLLAWLPFVGPLTVIATTIAGLGACVLGWRRRRRGTDAVPV